ncbi:hypothetical protein ABEB36_014737 [Hypothenemus hampei]|uniref:Dynein axonemal assembly factor 1 homolog n=1 Tax=Hypothenemus hampei TaxID=57062 RepID=A0ABD1E2Z0_HYPHA
MFNPCKERKPRVIDNALIAKCVEKQYPEKEVGRLLRLEGIPLEEVEEIRFEYLYILRIDHLWVLKSLVKLAMNNNLIEKIENLETLIHLRELDLSFNKIKKIENLEKLINLEKITFYENLIETIENLDNQKKLTVFSIGKNQILDRTNVHYFRITSKLTSLNMTGNPCAEEENFRLYVAAFLPTLVYYEYKRLDEKERAEGIEIFREELRQLEKIESEDKEIRIAIEKEIADVEVHSKMFVEFLNTGQLFDSMYENDDEGKALLDIGEEVTELFEEYKKQFTDYCKEVFEVGEKHYTLRQTELENFEKSVNETQIHNQNESIEYMEDFLEKKENIFTEIKEWILQLDHDAMTEDVFANKIAEMNQNFQDLIKYTWKKLMRLEVTLFEQIEEVNQIFGQTLGEMMNAFIEEVQAIFTNIRAAEVTYSENLNDSGVRFIAALNVNPDEEIPESLKDILGDRDMLNNAITATHDVHMQIIDAREDLLIQRVKDWLAKKIDQLNRDEITRNRYKVLEINYFLDKEQEQFDELTAADRNATNKFETVDN